MRKILMILFVSLISVTGCMEINASKVTIELYDQPPVISSLQFTVSGKVEAYKQDYIFYLIEDGHGFLSEGKINLQKNGVFNYNVSISPPTNEYGKLIFYADSNNDGIFDIELDTELSLASYDLMFHDSIVIPLSSTSQLVKSKLAMLKV
ncbi:hypothetical protein [Paenibacillus marinisediminis]